MSGFTALNRVVAKPVVAAQDGSKDEHVKTPAPTPAPISAVASVPPAPAPAPVEAPASVPAAIETSGSVRIQAPTVPSSRQRESWPTQDLERTPPMAAQGEAESPSKRKRSDSTEGRTKLPTEPSKRAQRALKRAEGRTQETTAVALHQQLEGHHQNGTHPQSQSHSKEKNVQSEANASPHAEPQVPLAQYQAAPPFLPGRAPTEQQLVQRQPQSVPVTPRDNSQVEVQYQKPADCELPSSGPVAQQDPRKRKREYSTRSRTGCFTCRRRRRKCDEAKPKCNNCKKSEVLCAGYPSQLGAGWARIFENNAGGVSLTSNDPNYVPPIAYHMPAPQPAVQGQPSGDKGKALPQYGQYPRIEALKGPDDPSGPPSRGMTSPRHEPPEGPYTSGTDAYPTLVSSNSQPPVFGSHAPSYYQQHHDTQTPPVYSAQMATQMALSHAQAQPHNMATVPDGQTGPTEREKMFHGGFFRQYDAELSMDRDRAATACWRFNALTYPPPNGVSTEERARLFLEIIQPRDCSMIPINQAAVYSNLCRVGRHVAVESPFNCDYGYNISIGNHVVISKNCTMNDAGLIHIGDNCIIGPNVSMYTTELSINPRERQGGRRTQQGRGIIINPDCWIGGSVIITPGRVIGEGSTVGAGSVVTQDVPPFTVVAGNPARVLRGVASF
ncbi:hypothetical protein PWT90_07628 [Aphanocladium album]|nr:hypothetical protein PWT90_07628 [Aphanocladium album]